MYSQRDFMIFVAGGLALHGFVSLLFKYSGVSPIKMYGYIINNTTLLFSVVTCILFIVAGRQTFQREDFFLGNGGKSTLARL